MMYSIVMWILPTNEQKGTYFGSPSSLCGIVHKTAYFQKPPGRVDFSLQQKEEYMKRIFSIPLILIALAACTPGTHAPVPSATDTPQANLPNPASLYCEQNDNTLEILTAEDGSQSGVCVFPDGSTCDEWAYFRGECGPATQASPAPAVTVEATSTASIDSTQENASGGYMAPGTSEKIADWWGVIKSTEPGAQYDDYFERQDLGQIIYFGIDSLDPAVQAQIKTLRDSGKIVHLYGTLFSNVPDYNGSQVQVKRIVVEG
jgi:putative hemolysin